jgi:hypothetical protein
MTTNTESDLEEIRAALLELNEISLDEYGVGLEDLLLDRSPNSALRVQRLTGIVLKRPFANRAGSASASLTGARRSWPWAPGTPEDHASVAPKELTILNQLRMPGPWNERKPLAGNAADMVPITWSELKDDADNERGLFKILALYVDDKLKHRDSRSFREYLDADETRRFEAGLDLATLVFDAAVTAPLLTLLGIPTVAVGVALVGIQFGYRKATDTRVERVGDRSS